MKKPTFNFISNHITMPEVTWNEVEKWQTKWQTNRSATIRRMIQEWLANQGIEVVQDETPQPDPATEPCAA